MSDVEKVEQVKVRQSVEVGSKDGYLLDASKASTVEGMKVSSDHHNVLNPQPSDNPHDPLNWSQSKKNLILFIISATAFLPDYGSATGAVTLIPQAKYTSIMVCNKACFTANP